VSVSVSASASVSVSVSSGDLSSVTSSFAKAMEDRLAKEKAAESKKPRVERSAALGTYRQRRAH
jgi:hypothetical protein